MKNKKAIYGVCKVGEKGQIVIPKAARDDFDIKPGDSVILLGDTAKGIAIVKADIIDGMTEGLFGEK